MIPWIIFTFFLVLQAKLLRDIINFRYGLSVLAYLPDWLQSWLLDGKPIFPRVDRHVKSGDRYGSADGWHVSDAFVIGLPWVLAVWMDTGVFWKAVASYPFFWVVFYQLFNFEYHWLLMRPDHRDLPWKHWFKPKTAN